MLKPLVENGGKPILWHIMKLYSFYVLKRFVLALGSKGEKIKKYFYPVIELEFKEDEVCYYS